MDKKVAVVIKSDPEKSHRAVEAIRIALGLVSGEHEVSVILLGQAVLLLGEDAEDLVDGEELMKYLPPLRDLDQTIYVEQGALGRIKPEETDFKIKPVSIQQVSDLLARADRHLVF